MSKSDTILEAIVSASTFTISDIAAQTNASTALINSIVKRELAKGLLKQTKKGRNVFYKNLVAKEGNVQVAAKIGRQIDINVEERFQFISHFTKMVGENVIPSLLLTGQPGTGKTFTVVDTLDKIGKEEGEDYVVVKGYSSAFALYRSLFENNDKIIVYDDCDSVLRDAASLNILKAALDSYSTRIVSWNSLGAERNELPTSFEFTGSIIFISNMDANRLDSAVVSRTVTANLLLSNDEIIDRMVHIAGDIEKSIPLTMKTEVIDFLREYQDNFEGLSLRTFIQACRIRKGSEKDWKKMILWTIRD